MSDLSVYNVSVKLQDLMARRADLTSELVCSPEQRDASAVALELLEQEITAFLHSELVRDKIDGVAGYLRLCPARGKEARAEAARLIAYADSIEGRAEYLKSVLLKIMDAAGQPRLEGRNSIIRKQANGGKVPVVVSVPGLLPETCVIYEGRISGQAYAALKVLVPSWLERQDVVLERKPHLGRIAAALEEGEGVPGAAFGERSSHVRVA